VLCYPHSCSSFFCCSAGARRDLPSFPTRRSSDLRHQPGVEDGETATEDREEVESHPQQRDLCRRGGAVLGLHEVAELTDAQLERSEEHTSELQSREKLVCRLLLEKKKLCSST